VYGDVGSGGVTAASFTGDGSGLTNVTAGMANNLKCTSCVSPPEVWNFHIGGYQVCEKWLKDRRGRTLSYEDLEHYAKVVTALRETIRLMAEIDAAIPKWPIS
jgi:hypothetical protein